MVEDTPDDVIHDLFAERIWPQHPLGRPDPRRPEGRPGLRRGTRCCDYFRTEYCPERITIAAAGHLRHEQLVDLLGSRFLDFRRPGTSAGGRAARPGDHASTSIERPLEQVHFVLGRARARAGRPRALRAVPPEHDLRGQHVLAPVPGGAGARGAGLLDPLRATPPSGTAGSSTCTRGPSPRTSGGSWT